MAFTSGRRNASHDTVHEPMIVSQGRPWSGWTTVWTMQVGLLGPLRVVGKDGVEIGVGAPKERAVLELLALRTGQVVPARSLIDALWGEDPPSSATKTLQTYISSLRRLMPVGAIETVGGGYRLVVPTDAVDALHFEELVRRGGRALQQADLKGAAEALAAALRLWRGEPLVDMGGQQTGIAEAARLSELRRDCEEQLAEARLALGEHHSLVADLETAVAADPLRERRWAQLMVALYRAGRQADALRAFQRLRRILADDLGLEPSAELRALEDAILRQAPELAWRRSVPVGELTNPVPAPTDARRSASADEPLTGRPESPTGALVTFLFTDIESSTSLWEQHPALMAAVLERHDRLAGDVMRTEGGHVFKVVGDAVHAVFTSPVAAIRAALAMQATVAGTDWGEIGCMRVRIGIYTGEARLVDGEWRGRPLNRCARLRDAAGGGEILASHATVELVGDDLADEAAIADLGEQQLRGVTRVERIHRVERRRSLTAPAAAALDGFSQGEPRRWPAATDQLGANLMVASRRWASRRHRSMAGAVAVALPLLGRDEHLDLLTDLMAGAGGRAFAVVAGEAGCGKTRLLEEFEVRAAATSRLVAATSAEDDNVLPYRPFADLVRTILAAPMADACLEQLGALVPELVWLVPEVAAGPLEATTDAGLARIRLFEAVVELCMAASQHQPLVWIVDDGHCMGLEMAALLNLLLERSAGSEMTIVLAARPEPGGASKGFEEVVRRHRPMQVNVGRLSRGAVAELAQQWSNSSMPRGSFDGDSLYDRTEGIPLLLSAVLADPQHGNRGEPHRLDIGDLVASRTQALGRTGRKFLEVAALAGSAVSPELVATVTGHEGEAVRGVLNGVVAEGGLLVAGELQDSYVWKHSLIREAVIDSLEPAASRQLREAIGGALSDQGQPLRAARQAVDVLTVSAQRVLPTVLAGIDEALRTLAFELAEDLCSKGLALGGRLADPALAVGLLTRMGRCLAYKGERDAAVRTWQEAARMARETHKPELLAEVALATEPYARSTVNLPLRWSLLNEAVAVHSEVPRATQVRVISEWINEGALPQNRVTDSSLVAQVVDLAHQQSDDRLLAMALDAKHNALRASQEVPIDISNELCQTAAHLSDPHWRARAHLLGLIDAITMAHLDEAQGHLEAYLRAADGSLSPRSRWEASMVCSTWAMWRGDVDSSDRHAQTAVEAGQRYGIEDAPRALGIHLFFRAFHAGTLSDLVGPLTQFADEHPEILAWRAGAGLAMAAAGDHRGAMGVRDEVLPLLLNPGVDPTWPTAACLTAQLCWETGAEKGQTKALLSALGRYPGRVAVIGRFIGECGPKERYLGLLCVPHDGRRARRLLLSAKALSDQISAGLWAERATTDLDAIGGVGA